MNTTSALQEITRLYASPTERAKALSELLSEIKYYHASLSSDKLAYFFIDIRRYEAGRDTPLKVKFLESLVSLVEYYLEDLKSPNGVNSPIRDGEIIMGYPTEAELMKYEDIYHSFGELVINISKTEGSNSTPMDIRIFLVLCGVSRKLVYPEVIMELYNSIPRR
jgi:hypothetical protein